MLQLRLMLAATATVLASSGVAMASSPGPIPLIGAGFPAAIVAGCVYGGYLLVRWYRT